MITQEDIDAFRDMTEDGARGGLCIRNYKQGLA